MITELFLCICLLCQLYRLIQSGHTLDCFGIFVPFRRITFPLHRGCTQVSSPAGHNSDLISDIPCTGTWGASRNDSFPFTINTLFVIKQDKDVNGLLLGCSDTDLLPLDVVIDCWWIYGQLLFINNAEWSSAGGLNGKGTAIPYLFPFHWLCSYRTQSENKLCSSTHLFHGNILCGYKIIHQKGFSVWLLMVLCVALHWSQF